MHRVKPLTFLALWVGLSGSAALALRVEDPAAEQLAAAQALEQQLADWNAAFAAGEAATVLAELDLFVDPSGDARLANLRGLCLMSLERPAEAIAAFETAIRTDPDVAAPHRNLGIVLDSLGQLGRALSEFQQALELDPFDPEARVGLARAQIRTRRYDQARQTLAAADSSDLRLLRAQAELADATGDPGLAARSWRRLEARAPDAESARRLAEILAPSEREDWLRRCLERDASACDCRAALAQSLLQRGDAAGGAALLWPMLESPPMPVPALHNLLLALQSLGDWAAVDSVCARQEPQQGASWGIVALARRQGGRGAAALRAVERGRALAPEDLDLANLEAVLRSEAGDLATAERVWRWILERDPSHVEAGQNLSAAKAEH